MQGCERDQPLERSQNVLVDPDGLAEIAATMDHAVADRGKASSRQLTIQKFEQVGYRVAVAECAGVAPFLLVHDAILRVFDNERRRAMKTFDLTVETRPRVISRVCIERKLDARRTRVQNKHC